MMMLLTTLNVAARARGYLGLMLAGGALLSITACQLGLRGTGDDTQDVSLPLSDGGAIEVEPGSVSSRVATVDLGAALTADDAATAEFVLLPQHMSMLHGAADEPATGLLTVSLHLGATEADPCASGASAGAFDVVVEGDTVVSVDPPALVVPMEAVEVVGSGAFALCLTIEASFTGQVQIDEMTFRMNATPAGGDNLNANDHEGQDNDNDDPGAGNDNGDDDSDDDHGGNVNDNASDDVDDDNDNSADDDGDDDNANDNSDDDAPDNDSDNNDAPDNDNSDVGGSDDEGDNDHEEADDGR